MPSSLQARLSLRWQLVLCLLIPLTILMAINLVITRQVAVAAANAAYDLTLLASARAIAEQVTVGDSEVQVDLPYAALEMFESSMRDRIFYRVSLANGQLITGYADLPVPRQGSIAAYRPIVYETGYQGERVRVAALSKPLHDARFDGPVLIQVAETLESRRQFTREILSDAAWRQAAMIIAAALLVWLGVQWGTRPLTRLSAEIAGRKQNDLAPIDEKKIQTEVRPLVHAMNLHMARLEALINAQRRFIADASHQLKTPLTLLNTQAEFVLRQENSAAIRAALGELRDNTLQVVRLANQLLMLARAEPDSGAAERTSSIDLAALARTVCLEWSPAAVEKRIDLSFDAPDRKSFVTGSSLLLHELAANLVDNAIRYTPPGGAVNVSVKKEGNSVCLEVEDNGPGIPAAERERVFDRFYRLLGTAQDGSGLGLAIVGEICRSHDAAVALRDPPGGRGLSVRVLFREAAVSQI